LRTQVIVRRTGWQYAEDCAAIKVGARGVSEAAGIEDRGGRFGLLLPTLAYGQTAQAGGGEASLKLPDLSTVNFLGLNGHALLTIGLLFCVGGLLFGLTIYVQLKNLPVHRTMREMSELIYETCKTYLVTQGKFILLLWVFIAVIISLYFGVSGAGPGKPLRLRCRLFCCSRWSASRAATAWRGSEFA
jgi:hypothetical protein